MKASRATLVRLSIGLIFVFSACWGVYVFLWEHPQELLHENRNKLQEKDFLEADGRIRGNVLAAIGGLSTLIGLYVAWRNFAENQRIALENQLLSERGQMTQRFTDAVDQVGSDKTQVRVGGLHALGRILNDAQRASRHPEQPCEDYWPIVDLVTYFIRSVCPTANYQDPSFRNPSVDVQAALNVIGRRQFIFHRDYDSPFDASGLDLRGAFMKSFHLEAAHLADADLRWTYLAGANLNWADLTNANLQEAILDRADLSKASGLTQGQINSANGSLETKLPAGISRPGHWPVGSA